MAGKLTMRCPQCRREMTDVDHEDTDPLTAVLVVLICPDCDDGDRHSPTYFDAEGHEVMWFDGYAGRAFLTKGAE